MTTDDLTHEQLRAALSYERASRAVAEKRAASTADERVVRAEAKEATMLATLTAAQAASTRDIDGARAARRELAAVRVLLDAATRELGERSESTPKLDGTVIGTVEGDCKLVPLAEYEALRNESRALREVEMAARMLLMVAGDDATGLDETEARCVTDLRAALAAYADTPAGHEAIAQVLAIRDELDGHSGGREREAKGTEATTGVVDARRWLLDELELARAKFASIQSLTREGVSVSQFGGRMREVHDVAQIARRNIDSALRVATVPEGSNDAIELRRHHERTEHRP